MALYCRLVRFLAGMGPGDDLEIAVVALGHRRAAFDPIAAIDVAQAELVVHRRRMDVAADDAVEPGGAWPLSPAPSRRPRYS